MDKKTNDLSEYKCKNGSSTYRVIFRNFDTYIMLVPHMKLKREVLAGGYVELEDEELVYDVETWGHADFFRSNTTSVMKVCGHLWRVGRQLNALAS